MQKTYFNGIYEMCDETSPSLDPPPALPKNQSIVLISYLHNTLILSQAGTNTFAKFYYSSLELDIFVGFFY